jgi:hypothetical protein
MPSLDEAELTNSPSYIVKDFERKRKNTFLFLIPIELSHNEFGTLSHDKIM